MEIFTLLTDIIWPWSAMYKKGSCSFFCSDKKKWNYEIRVDYSQFLL
jgi:hypothetical protein